MEDFAFFQLFCMEGGGTQCLRFIISAARIDLTNGGEEENLRHRSNNMSQSIRKVSLTKEANGEKNRILEVSLTFIHG